MRMNWERRLQPPCRWLQPVEADAERTLRYRNIAGEIRARVADGASETVRKLILKLADDYDMMAEEIERRIENPPDKTSE